MIKIFKISMLVTFLLLCNSALAKRLPETYTKNLDFSGVYTCTGQDAHEGDYTGTVTMTRKPEHSQGAYASYDFKLEVLGYGTYLGHAAANGLSVAMHFALTDQTTKDFGTGIAKFSRIKTTNGLSWQFDKFYFEPEFKGGNTGHEHCVKQ